MSTTDRTAEDFLEGLTRFSRALRTLAHNHLSAAGEPTRRSDAQLLKWLARRGEARSSDLAETCGLDASVISRQITGLEAAGLVARRPDPADARASLLRLTHDGEECLASYNREYVGYLQRMFADWDDRQVADAALLLNDLSDLMAQPQPRPTDPSLASLVKENV